MSAQQIELNQNMRQAYPAFGFNHQEVPVAPFAANQGYGQNETETLNFVPTMAPIRNQTQASSTETFNAANLNPRTYQGGNVKAMIPYGYARGQLSLFTNLEENAPGQPLIMSNASVFQQVRLDETPQFVMPSTL